MKIRYKVRQRYGVNGGQYQVLLKQWMIGSVVVFERTIDSCTVPNWVLVGNMILRDPECKSIFSIVGSHSWTSKFAPYDKNGVLPDDYSKRHKTWYSSKEKAES